MTSNITEKVEDYREILDVVLEGNRKIVETIKAIKDVKEGKEPAGYSKLARMEYTDKHREALEMQKPQPPKSSTVEFSAKGNFLVSLFEEVSAIRTKIEKYREIGIMGKKEMDELITDVYVIQSKIYNEAS